MKIIIYPLAFLLFLFTALTIQAQSWWSDATETDAIRIGENRLIVPEDYRLVDIDLEQVKAQLAQAPRWFTPEAVTEAVELTFPMPDGTYQSFRVVEAPVMSPELSARYPGMHSFAGKSRTDATAYARFGYTHKGFHAMILSGEHSTVFIDIYAGGQHRFHQVYYKEDYQGIPGNEFVCHLDVAAGPTAEGNTNAGSLFMGDCLLRDYRLALACTGEYAQFHGGTVPDVMAAYNVAMTRVNGVYERDLTVHMELIGSTDELIFLDGATDPYTNGSGVAMLGENQNTIDEIVGFNNYDVGHVFSTGGGGVASLNAPCNSNKARGVTGLPSPVNDPFYIDYVSHEFGHQFGANHTQNNSCNRVNATAMEPGSASTIMGYAGICNPNVQNNSDDHFHAISIQEITNNIEFGSGGSCPEIINTGNIGPSVTIASSAYNLPVSTPFFLTAIASDADEDELAYCWEQMDNEIADMPPLPTNDGGPAFRSNSPVPSPTRYFPNLPAVIDNITPEWEVVPSVGREMNFRCTVRDNVIGGGCTSSIDVSLSFSENAGPFEVLAPNTPLTWLVGEEEAVSWEVANTDAAPVSCSEVDIYLSTDGGMSYPIALATNVPNTGSATITVPLELTNEARVQVVCADNIFYDISNENFIIEEPPTPGFLFSAAPDYINQCNDVEASFELQTTVVAGFDETLSFSVSGLPDSATATFTPNTAAAGEAVMLVVSDLEDALPGTYTLEVEATALPVTELLSVTLELDTGAPGPVTLIAPASGSQLIAADSTLSWNAALQADEYLIEIATSPVFDSTIVESATLANTTYQPSGLEELTVYYWRVSSINRCGSTEPSGTFSFQTLKTNCRQFINNDPGLVIPDDGTGIYSSALEVPDSLEIFDLNCSIDIAHTWVGDLTAILQSPSGLSIPLFDQPGVPASTYGCSNDNLLVSFDDEAESTAEDFENSCSNGAYAIEGIFQPLNPLSNFDNENSAGEWTLDIFDGFNQDGGNLLSWSLEVCLPLATVEVAEQVANIPLEVFRGRSDTIGSNLLAHEKAGFSPAEITYRITGLPDHGLLLRFPEQDTLGVGAAITQAAIDVGALIYQHDSSMTVTDQFRFDLDDPEGGWLANRTFNILIVEPDTLSAMAEITGEIRCAGGSEGRIEVNVTGGIPPYQYSLDGTLFQSSPLFDNLPEGTYTITITDDAGMVFETEPAILVDPAPLQLTAETSGSGIILTAEGGTPPYQYSIDGGTTFTEEAVYTDLSNGSYDIVLADANSCEAFTTAAVNIIIDVQIAITNTSCADTEDGMIDASTVVGGVPPFLFRLEDGLDQEEGLFEGLPAGTYTLEVEDANGYIYLLEVDVLSPAPLAFTATAMENIISITASGGTLPYQYSIDGGITFSPDPVFAGLQSGIYDVLVVDASGCESEIEMVNIMISSTERPSLDWSVQLLPNPTQGKLWLEAKGLPDAAISWQVLNSLGQPLLFGLAPSPGGECRIPLSLEHLPAGTYWIWLRSEDGEKAILPVVKQ